MATPPPGQPPPWSELFDPFVAAAELLKAEGNALVKQRQYAEASACYERSLQLLARKRTAAPQTTGELACHLNRAHCALQTSSLGAAVAACDAAVTLAPRSAKALFRRAKARQLLGSAEDLALARADCAAALAAKPADKLIAALLAELGGAPLGLAQLAEGVVGGLYDGSADGADTHLLLLLHGLGDGAAPFRKLAAKMALPATATLALQAPFALPLGLPGHAWVQGSAMALAGEGAGAELAAGLAAAAEQVLALVLRLEPAVPRERIFLLGYDEGAAVAIAVAERCSGGGILGGVIAVSPSLLRADDGVSGRDRAPPFTEVLLTHGHADAQVPAAAAERLRDSLGECTLSQFDKGHEMISGEGEMRAIMGFIAERQSHAAEAAAACPGAGQLYEVTSQSGDELIVKEVSS